MFFLYESLQIILLLFGKIFAWFSTNKKFKRFIFLRNPKQFYIAVQQARNSYASLIRTRCPLFWLHISSAGELEQTVPIARNLHNKLGAYFFVTYYSPSAEPFLKNFPALIGSAGLPLDIRKVYKNLLMALPISKIFFVRYDLWPALICICKQENIEINLLAASAKKTKKGIIGLFSKYWTRLFYKHMSNVFAVSHEDVNYFLNFLPAKQVYFAGDAKWARALERKKTGIAKENQKEFSLFISFCMQQKKTTGKKIIVLGSPHLEEHKIALLCAALKEKLLLVYVPHNVDFKNCQSILHDFSTNGINGILYSELVSMEQVAGPPLVRGSLTDTDAIVVNKVGFLAEIYQVAEVCIVGGGFDGQIHNVLEPAAYGVPVLIGNEFARSSEAKELVDAGAAISFQTPNEIFQFLCQWVNLDWQEPPLVSGSSPTNSIKRLAQARAKALGLFQSIPDTSEIILQALLKEQKIPHGYKTVNYQ